MLVLRKDIQINITPQGTRKRRKLSEIQYKKEITKKKQR